jgi:hypothetical protein
MPAGSSPDCRNSLKSVFGDDSGKDYNQSFNVTRKLGEVENVVGIRPLGIERNDP